MKSILLLKTSLNGDDGNSNKLALEFLQKYTAANPATVQERDLASSPLPHLSLGEMTAWATAEDDRDASQQELAALSDQLISELKNTDTLIIGMPMYNFGVPSTFKAWIDRIARAGVTFSYTSEGPVGLLENKKVYIIAARGGVYAGTTKDTQTHYLRDILALVGLTDVEFIYAEGLNMQNKEESLLQARAAMDTHISNYAAM